MPEHLAPLDGVNLNGPSLKLFHDGHQVRYGGMPPPAQAAGEAKAAQPQDVAGFGEHDVHRLWSSSWTGHDHACAYKHGNYRAPHPDCAQGAAQGRALSPSEGLPASRKYTATAGAHVRCQLPQAATLE